MTPVLLLHMFSPTVGSQNVRIIRNVVFYDLENPGHLASRAEFCGTLGHSLLKSIKLGLSSENRDEWGPYVCRNWREAIYQSSLGLVPFTLEESTTKKTIYNQ